MDQLTAVSEYLKLQAAEERAEQSAAQISLIACQIAAGSIKVSVKSVVSFYGWTKRISFPCECFPTIIY